MNPPSITEARLPRIVSMEMAAAFLGLSKRHFNKYLTSENGQPPQFRSFLWGGNGKRFMTRDELLRLKEFRAKHFAK